MKAKDVISKNLKNITHKFAKNGFDIELAPSDKPENGDYTTNIAMRLASNLKKSPREVGEKIKEEYDSLNDPNISKVEVAGPGFINFFLSNQALRENMSEILSEGDKYGGSKINKGKKVVVEYSSPNIAKPFTVGHLRSTIIGDAIANLLEATGYKVYRDNHLGDWGTQFGKQIYAIKAWGDEKKIEKSENPVKELVALYIKFHEEAEKDPELEERGREWFKKLEEGEPEARRLWQKCVDWSMIEFKRLYSLLGVSFTENGGKGYGEAFFENKMGDVIKELKEKKLLTESEGAQIVKYPGDKYPPLMVLKQDGATLYATHDLATDKFRLKHYGSDVLIVNEVGAEQALYFMQLYELEKMLSWVKEGQRVHVKHGHFRFREGKMSTRKGNVIWLEDVLEEAIKRAQKLAGDNKSRVDEVGIGALKWNELKRNPIQDVVFDWDDILNMNGNSGPYMQYAFVRTQSILEKAKDTYENGIFSSDKAKEMGQEMVKEEEELLRFLIHFQDAVINSAEGFSPNLLTNYLFELAQKFNLFYQKVPIIKSEDIDQRSFRLSLVSSTGQVLKNGLGLLGIRTVEKM